MENTTTDKTVGTVQPQLVTLTLPAGGFQLEKGGFLPEVRVAYERCGVCTATQDNVIFVCHALTGDAHVAGLRPGETEPSGWWEGLIGPGKAIDTNHYHVICANILGGCKGTTGPSSINPETGKPYGSAFPKITVRDIIEVHRLLLKQLGVQRLYAVIGGSFGGMQIIEWVARYSEEIDRAIIVASAASLNSQALAFDIVGRHAIIADPNWNNGDYYDQEEQPHSGLSSARKLAHITYLSQDLMDEKFGREKRREWLAADTEFKSKIDRNFGTYFQVESYLQYQGEKFIQRFDANSYLHITLAMDEYDAVERYGSLDKAFEKVQSQILIVAMSGDWLFMPEQSEVMVSALVRQQKRVSYCLLKTEAGHDAFLTHICDLTRIVNAFIEPATEMTYRPVDREVRTQAYQRLVDLIPNHARVLDLGCGDGLLLDILRRQKNVSGNGIEIDVEKVIAAIMSGADILLEDIDEGLGMIPDKSYDVVILSETLQTIKKPREILRQILRVANEAVISFPNFACFHVRTQLLFSGRMPKGKAIPYEWYDTPNIHLFTLKDFLALCEEEHFVVANLVCTAHQPLDRLLLMFGAKNSGAENVTARITRR